MRAILKIIPGNGSEECLDWAAMLTRMFVAWGEKGGWPPVEDHLRGRHRERFD